MKDNRRKAPPAAGRSLPPARAVALDAIRATLPASGAGTELQAALDAAIRARKPDGRDAALATQLVYGFFRRKGELDAVLALLLRDPQGLPPSVRDILALALYELYFLDRVPAYATVDWAVEAVKTGWPRQPGLASLTNGLLRRADREREHLPPSGPSLQFAPAWLAELWTAAYGRAAAERLFAASQTAPPVGIRLNRAKDEAAARAFFERHAPDAPWAERPALALPVEDSGISAEELRALEVAGVLSRQSAAGQQALAALVPPGFRGAFWDACAGRGGKAMWLLESGAGPGTLSDVNARRLRDVPGELERLGLAGQVTVLKASATEPLPISPAPSFPLVLIDAPCSGLGVLARRPDAIWKRQPSDVATLVGLQARILSASSSSVTPGGCLIYMTCTLNPAENQERVAAFVAEHPDFVPETTFQTPFDSPLAEFYYGVRLRRAG